MALPCGHMRELVRPWCVLESPPFGGARPIYASRDDGATGDPIRSQRRCHDRLPGHRRGASGGPCAPPWVVSHLDMDWESPEDIRNSLPSAVRRVVGDRSRGAAGGRVRRPADEADSGKAELVGNVKQEMVRLRAGIEELERELGTGDG
jgi:hypothetical protein